MVRQTRQLPTVTPPGKAQTAVVKELRGLRSCRTYLDEPVAEVSVQAWLDAARWCGSSRNSQPWRFVVVRDAGARQELAALGGHTSHLAGAPLVIVLASVDGPFPFSRALDLGRVAQSLMLAAAAEGVGSCIGVFEPPSNMDRARKLLGIPIEMHVDLAIGFGWPTTADPAPVDAASPSPSGRLPLAQLVSYERYGTASPRS